MNYDEFKNCLIEEIQANCEKAIIFTDEIVTKANEVLEGLTMRFEGDMVAPTIYPQKLYANYQQGVPISKMAEAVSSSLLIDVPEIPKPL